MRNLITSINQIISDYHCDAASGFTMGEDHIEDWINQFDEHDRMFILEEFLHILKNGMYVSKKDANLILIQQIERLSKVYGYTNIQSFLKEAVFLNLQPNGKSQGDLLNLFEQYLIKNYGVTVSECGVFNPRHYIYIDDIMASGKTILKDCKEWFNSKNLEKCNNKEITFNIVLFCKHLWAESRVRWSLKCSFDDNYFTSSKFRILSRYEISDDLNSHSPLLNLTIPKKLSSIWDVYLGSLTEADAYHDRAYRYSHLPKTENFYSSPSNRDRFEQILLDKGIEIIYKIEDEEKRKNHRPLGKTYSHYKTFGTGSLFFTWRNISNTCPIVFWWDVPKHNWKGLFPLINRGN
ncbi:phosphoribosyltransferase-like protein [Edaphocola flava]|uniref:phosphoribosyltransferase-like protein n=1 Tax=Edaphocola flava TaxID=2499629 RepID=UPI00100A3FDB|nr:hypothetical protein [Edaphocola flava]